MTPNIIIQHPETKTTEIVMTRLNGDTHSLLVDDKFYPLLQLWHFHCHETRHKSGKFYAATHYKGKLLFAHRLIMEPFLSPEFPEIDHIRVSDPNNTLDCRVSNLRVVNRHEQMHNLASNHMNHTVPTRPHYVFMQQGISVV